MLQILDNVLEIEKLDKDGMLKSIQKLSSQIEQIEKDVSSLKLPNNYKKIKNVVFAGMGGSALGAHLIKSVFKNEISVPFEIVNDYSIPKFAGKDTLVLVASYSGNTEEVLAAFKNAEKNKSKIFIITSGGELEKLAVKKKIPALIFKTVNNPCGSPRMGLGYTLFGPLLILEKLGIVEKRSNLKEVGKTIRNCDQKFGVSTASTLNEVKQIAEKIQNSTVWFIGAEHLSGSTHIAANQMNENAKRFGGYFLIPELNHHLMEGLVYPKTNYKFFLFFESDLYDLRSKKRFEITKEVLMKNNIPFASYRCEGKSRLLDSTEALVFGSYLGFYAAMLEGIDPTSIPYVDFFKAALKK